MSPFFPWSNTVYSLRQRVKNELRSNILPFWLKHAIDEQYGSFRGQIANDLTVAGAAEIALHVGDRQEAGKGHA
jgi:mannose/cellobiose epimerase-like protein (N-acyl-D-glucosamine 2-epimerase family)